MRHRRGTRRRTTSVVTSRRRRRSFAAATTTTTPSLSACIIAIVVVVVATSSRPATAVEEFQSDSVVCEDSPGWIDSFGDDCSYYSSEDICIGEGGEGDGGMGVAQDNCCGCGGGNRQPPPVVVPTTTPQSQSATSDPTPMKITPGPTSSNPTMKPTTPASDPTSEPTAKRPTQLQPVEADDVGLGWILSGVNDDAAFATDPTTKAPPTSSAVANDDTDPPLVGGTCGGGERGDGICPDGRCCSEDGLCGTTPLHCGGLTYPPTLRPSTSPTTTGAPTTLPPTTSSTTAAATPESAMPPPSTGSPTASPTERDWSAITPGHTSFCGPKLVGGYEVAKSTCSRETECGKKAGENTSYGSSGNDCPKNSMCFTEISCLPPTSTPSAVPTDVPSRSARPTLRPSVTISVPPSGSGRPTTATAAPTNSRPPTAGPTTPPRPLAESITSRGSFCGRSFGDALGSCSPRTSCHGDEDCGGDGDGDGDGECFPNISCTFHPSEAAGYPWEEDADEDGGDDAVGHGVEFESDGINGFETAYGPPGNGSGGRGSCWFGAVSLAAATSIALVII